VAAYFNKFAAERQMRSRMKDYEPNFADRQKQAAEARQAQLKKAQLKAAAANDPEALARQAERRANAEAREIRIAERNALKIRQKEEALAQAAAKAEEDARQKEREAALRATELAEQKERAKQKEIEAKAERDRRYAARKARKK
jgi:hypothetical protein